jgi:hypothetical protein
VAACSLNDATACSADMLGGVNACVAEQEGPRRASRLSMADRIQFNLMALVRPDIKSCRWWDWARARMCIVNKW